MNYIWSGIIVISVVCAIINGRADELIGAISKGSKETLETVFSFAPIMCFWCGIMKIAEKSGVINIIKKAINPVISRLFPNASDKAKAHISMNLCANILGLGNAATPQGIMAMSELDKINKNPKIPSYEMCMLIVLNTTSFQLIPTTIMSLRAAAGGDAASVIVPIWVASCVSVISAVTAVKILFGRKK